MSRTSKMMQYVNWRMRVQISDRRTLLGTFMAYDKHMNIILGDTEEYRLIRGKKNTEEREEKRMLGLVLLRGENVIAISAEAPPAPQSRAAQAIQKAGPGKGRAAGRGTATAALSAAPKGLAGPIRGVGGPSGKVMLPQATISGTSVSYGRGSVMGGQRPSAPPPPSSGGGPRPPFMGGPPGGRPGGMMMGRPPMMGRGGPPMMRPPPMMGMRPPPMMGRGMPPRPPQ